jgi:hypothetical protein
MIAMMEKPRLAQKHPQVQNHLGKKTFWLNGISIL